MTNKKITVIGGGTGTSVVLSGLKDTKNCDLNAIVVVSDSGGSTGRLKDEFGFLPVGDLRQCLAALADGKYQNDIRQLLLYRFQKGQGLEGHNLGNLILTALEDIENSPAIAIETASQIFRTKGSVYPVTETKVELVIEYQDGTVKIGEDVLDNPSYGGKKIKSLKLSPRAGIYHKAKTALLDSDLIIMGPGDLYASLLPNTLVSGFKKALKNSKAKFVYIINLMTHYCQTHQMTASDHVKQIEKYCEKTPDVVIINDNHIPEKVLKLYAKQKEYPVQDDLNGKYKVIRGDFLSKQIETKNPADKLPRSLLRHDPQKLALALIKI